MKVFGTHDQKTLDQLAGVAENAEKVALMADGHFGYVMPVGGVAAYRGRVSVSGVGFDIACGNLAVKTSGRYWATVGGEPESWEPMADEIQAQVSFGVGRKNRSDDAPVDHPVFSDPRWDVLPPQVREPLRDKARSQLGTVGSGNHYVDLFADEEGYIWVGVHFGSRGLGHTVASGFLALASGAQWGARVPETEALLDLSSQLGKDYWDLMELCGEYAYAGREWVASKVVKILGCQELAAVHNHHNFAWKEHHFLGHLGRAGDFAELVVVRKGATPAWPGQKGFVGGSMADDAVILQGANISFDIDSPEWDSMVLQAEALYSTVHGAGRVMSRTEARGKVDRRTGELLRPGKVTPAMMRESLDQKGVVLRGGGLDEAPHAYRRLADVLAAQGPTVEVLHTLRPLVVVMAGADEFDPYKD